MNITFYGTRGSVPVAGAYTARYGGNTTCLRVDSQCLPPGSVLAVDAGSGFLPLAVRALQEGANLIHVFFTHYHHDHTQGLPLSRALFAPGVELNLYGPVEHGIDPAAMLADMMRPPYFPVAYASVASRIRSTGIENPAASVLVGHPRAGLQLLSVEMLERAEQSGEPRLLGYPVEEFLIVRMQWTNHPERTICYRFEERPTGQVFVFLTDHENSDGLPHHFQRHVRGADLLVMDSQYSRARYDSATAGFGHGTPDYCVRVALATRARRLGLTHHDPEAGDDQVDAILAEARAAAEKQGYDGQLLACRDYAGMQVGNG